MAKKPRGVPTQTSSSASAPILSCHPGGATGTASTIRAARHGRVTIGTRDDGQPDRRHVGGKTRSEVAARVRALERERDQGTVRKAGERWTVGRWLTYWVENIAAPPHVAENTHNGYLVDVNKHLIPGLGAHRLERLTPDHVERLYAKLQRGGLSPGGVHHVHRTLRAALNEAVLALPPDP